MSSLDSKAVWPGWKTVRCIGSGSFGSVYEIERDVFGTVEKAALKVISIPQNKSDLEELYDNGYDDASVTETFNSHLKSIVNEYTLMREMNGSSYVVNCDDFKYVEHDDSIGWDILIKMELLTPLTKAFGKDMPEERVVAAAKDICKALILCRKYDIIHRDIKPQNIFVSKNGDYKLGDFGIAKTIEKTSGGTKIGTYRYMAPEVYNNQPYSYTSDIYSLGLVLHWLLNERRAPFVPLPPEPAVASVEETARQRRFSGEPIPAPAHGSEELKAIVLKACAYDPNDRYQSAAEMLDDLEKLEEGAYIPYADKVASAVAAAAVGAEKAVPKAAAGEDLPDDGTISLFDHQTEEEKAKKEEAAAAAAAVAAEEARKKAEAEKRRQEALKKAEEEARLKAEEEQRKKAENAAAAAAVQRQSEAPAEEKKKKKLVPILIAAVLLIALLVVLLLPKSVTMPDLIDRGEQAAVSLLKDTGLVNYRIEYEKSDSIAKGRVIKTDPVADTKISKKDMIVVTISAGDGTADVPDLSGKTKDEAEKLLADAGFKPEYEEAYDDKIANGSVIAQEPVSGTKIQEGSVIKVRLSKGPAPIDSHTISFDANGGTISEASRQIEEGTAYGKLPTPTRTGYTFKGWFTAKTGGNKVTDSAKMGTADVKLYAQWTANVYTLSFNANGGSVSETSRKVNEGAAYGNLPTPTKAGYGFNGWYTAATGGTKVSSSTKMGQSNVTVYAQWTANAYTLSFNANGGSVSEASRAVKADAAYGTLPTPTRTGFTFNGWYTAASGGTQVSSSTKMAKDNVTVYAHWTANTYTVSFNANGGSVSQSSKTVTYNAAYGTLPTPTREYYTFNGWYTAASGGTKVTASSNYTAGANQTLYAQWTQNGFGSWSSWGTTAVTANANREVQSETRWRYRDKQFTTSTSSSMSGWTLYNTTTSWSAWSAWSNYGLTAITANDYTEVRTTPLYRYYAYLCKNCGARYPYYGNLCSSCKAYTPGYGDWAEHWSTLPYGQGHVEHVDSIKSFTTSLGDGLKWFFGRKDIGKTAVGTVGDNAGGAVVIQTGYAKRTRTKITTYYYWKWGDWSSWSTTQATASDNREVQSAVYYRYRDRIK